MMHTTKTLSLAAPVLALLCVLPSSLRAPEAVSPAADAEAYTVDLVHSTILFKVNHLGISNAYGRFNKFSGDIQWAPEDLSQTSVSFEVDAASVDSNHEGRDDHLRGPDFFSVKEFSTWSFASKEVKSLGEDRYEVTGDITVRGKTEELSFEMEKTGEGESERFGKKVGFEAMFTVKRTEFGMSYAIPGIGDEVHVTLSIEANLAKD
ncbi:MAG: YceI family protein [Planctomycetes bacterium]|nr:YceI family protein [Planctomycetota bacterium]